MNFAHSKAHFINAAITKTKLNITKGVVTTAKISRFRKDLKIQSLDRSFSRSFVIAFNDHTIHIQYLIYLMQHMQYCGIYTKNVNKIPEGKKLHFSI